MRMSCNGCRVLRKGCSEGCTIRPCLKWIKSPEAQANATVFLAKFYGRAGLLNLLAAPGAGAADLCPAVFRSLLYEACGRIVNPVYGSVGLLWSGQWQACQAAVEAVLKGESVVQVSSGSEAAAAPPLGRACDIRHVARDPDAAAAADLLRVARAGRPRFKRASSSSSSRPKGGAAKPTNKRGADVRREQEPAVIGGSSDGEHDDCRAPSCHGEESAGSHEHHDEDMMAAEGSEDTEVEARSHVSQAEQQSQHAPVSCHQAVADEEQVQESAEVGLELTLGFQPVTRHARSPRSDLSAAPSLIGLRLELPA